MITAVYRTIDYSPGKVFDCLVEQVTEARRTGDVEKSKALLAEVFKLLGNSGYGKLIEALERQTNVIYTKDERVVDRALRSASFSDLDEIGQVYELESRKPRITIKRPFQVGIAVYQLAKLRMLEFYHDVLDDRSWINHQLFTDKPAPRAVKQIVDNRLVRFHHDLFNLVHL